jgi:ceramide glucosyltransferase
VLAKASGALALASLAYGAFALARTRAFAHRNAEPARETPFVTVLKPLHGAEPLLAEKLRSFCDQDYPDYEVILGTRERDDPALAIARAVASEFPRRVRVVDGEGAPRHANPKANTLAGMVPHARGSILTIADSDMRVDRDWLGAIVAPFADVQVGAVTCLYRGAPLDGLASTLGAMANHEHYAPSVLVAEALGPLRYCFGSTMAVRRSVFDEIGGLDAIGAHIADDALLGERVAGRGLRVVLSRYVVENVVDEPTLRTLWSHELRWARTHRVLRPAAYAGLVLTYPLPLALLHAALARRPAACAIVVAALGVRYALGASARRAFGVRAPTRPLLVPLRDAFGLAVWAVAFASPRVRWSGDAFRVERDGTLTPAERWR